MKRLGVFRVNDLWLEGDCQAVLLIWTHDQRMIPLENLQVVDVSKTGSVAWVIGDLLGLCPGGDKVIFDYDGSLALGSQLKGFRESLSGVRCGDRDDIPHAIHRDLLVYRKEEFAGDGVAIKCPVDFAVPEVEHFLLCCDEIGLLVAEVERFTKAEPGYTVFPIIGRNDFVFTKGEFRQHDRQVAIGRPIENSRAMRKCQNVRGICLRSIGQREVKMEFGFWIFIDKKPLFFSVGFIKDDKASRPFCRRRRQIKTDLLRPLAIRDHWQR